MSILAVFIGSILFFALSFKRLDWALMTILAGLPLYVLRFDVFGIPSTLLEVMILILFTVWFIKNCKILFGLINYKIRNCLKITNYKLKISSRYPFDIELTLVLIISFIAMGVAGFDNSAMGIWKAYFFEPIIVYLLIINIFFSGRKQNEDILFKGFSRIIISLSVAAFYVSVFAIYQKITGNYIPNELWAASETETGDQFVWLSQCRWFIFGTCCNDNVRVFVCSPTRFKKRNCERGECVTWSPFSMTWFWQSSLKDKVIFSFVKISLLLSVLAIYFARSEGALIAIGAAIVLMIFFVEPFGALARMRSALTVLVMVAISLVLFFSPLRQIALERLTLNDFSGQVRKAQWEETGIFLRDGNWLFGAGLAGYQEKIAPYHKNGIYIRTSDPNFDNLIKVDPAYQAKHWQPLEIFLYPHNIFLNFWVELGLAGMLLFLLIILKVLYLGFAILSQEKSTENRLMVLGIVSAMFVLVVHGIVDVPYFKNDLAILFWVMVGMMGVLDLKIGEVLTKNNK